MERPLISYDDITLPYQSPPPAVSPSDKGLRNASKRKWVNTKQQQQQPSKNGQVAAEDDEDEEEEDAGNRYLTQEEIWDDSALIDAWNAATEEYEAFNGPDKGWKNEPVHKSPLWYNVPPTKPPKKKLKTDKHAAAPGAEEGAENSKPLDFDTFVPNHDASLALPTPFGVPENYDYSALPPPSAGVASQDEAFQRALGAMYWGGYWTAVYHCHRSAQAQRTGGEDGEGEDGEEEGAGEEEEAFVPTQR
ncbi:hypothetical protein DFH07DRAFT_934589 [Mycena maculata]|uniref:Survival Motor Neuron Gemin2-binding domain-containing protein n=1 Tax=Mycena maculata TaxID=230809 RepID=A0AAD7H7V6_9AGAR|nr:hypothetical protein DFH07DRAFT_934589 [Mycena maculata]